MLEKCFPMVYMLAVTGGEWRAVAAVGKALGVGMLRRCMFKVTWMLCTNRGLVWGGR